MDYSLNKAIMKCLFKEVQQSYISPTEKFKYWCLTEFVYAYQVNTSLARTGISFQNNCHIFKLLLMFDMQYWKCNNISVLER